MTELDQIIRDSFTDQATEAPDGADLLHRIRHRDRQLTVYRRVLAGGIAAAVVGAGVPTADALTTGGSGAASVLSAPTADGTAPPTPHLEAAQATIMSVPLSPGWLPGPVTKRYVGTFGLGYQLGDDLPGVDILVAGVNPDANLPGSEVQQPATVAGTPATVNHQGGRLNLVWQRRPGQWVRVSWSPVTEAQYAKASTDLDSLIRVAESLRDEPVNVLSPFWFRWLPRGATVEAVYADQVFFNVPGGGTFVVAVQTGEHIPDGFRAATAGRWHGRIGLTDGGDGVPNNTEVRGPADRSHTAFFVQLDHDRILRVSGPSTELDQLDILAIAAGVTLTGR